MCRADCAGFQAKAKLVEAEKGVFYKVDFKADQRIKVREILRQLNTHLESHTNGSQQLKCLSPSWLPGLEGALEPGKLAKQLKKSQMQDGTVFDAREHQPIVLLGLGADSNDVGLTGHWEGTLQDVDGFLRPIDDRFECVDITLNAPQSSVDMAMLLAIFDKNDSDNIGFVAR